MDLPWSAIEDRVLDTTRWSVTHEIIFKYEEKFYRTLYSIGATEIQDERPWEYVDEVDCTEVKQIEKLIKVWEPV